MDGERGLVPAGKAGGDLLIVLHVEQSLIHQWTD